MHYLLRVGAFATATDRPTTIAAASEAAVEEALKAFHGKFTTLGDFAPRLLSLVMLNVLDEKWKDHLYDLDQLRGAIQYRSWGQKDPLLEYKSEAFSMFEDLMRDIQHTFTERFLKVQLVFDDGPRRPPPPPTPKRFNALGVAEEVTDGPASGDGGGTGNRGNEPPPEPKIVGAGRGVSKLATGNTNPGGVDFSNVRRNDQFPCGRATKFKNCQGAT
jgi:preprotein translocase subunit SecA